MNPAVDSADREDELPELRRLRAVAPASIFDRFRRRATVMQGTRTLVESQVVGFWLVLDAFLRLLLSPKAVGSTPSTNTSSTAPMPYTGDHV